MKTLLALSCFFVSRVFAQDAVTALKTIDYFVGTWECVQSGKTVPISAVFKKDLQDKWATGEFMSEGKMVERCHINTDSERTMATLVCMEVSKYWKQVSGTTSESAPWVLKGSRNLGKKSEALTQTLTFLSSTQFSAEYSNGDPKLTCTKK